MGPEIESNTMETNTMESNAMETDQQNSFRKITQGYTFKILLLGCLVLLFLIPLSMIRGLINERNRTAQFAESGIMEAWGGPLVKSGPIMAIPGVRTFTEIRTHAERTYETISTRPFTLIVTPAALNIQTRFETEIRRRGIFSVPLFSGELTLSGSFNPAAALASLRPDEEVFLDQAELIIALSSQTGIRRMDRAIWEGQELFFQPGNRGFNFAESDSFRAAIGVSPAGNGIFAVLPEVAAAASEFDIVIAIQGGQFVRFLPVGQDTRVEVSTDWPSPSFQGSFLPSASSISDSGFDAVWEISYLRRDIPLFWRTEPGTRMPDYSALMFGVNFFRTIDTYSLNTRAIKYAILFIIVPFLTLFLFEIFSRKRIHPVSYMLSGIANVIFYLLLLSLSEHMLFHFAYIIAAFSVTIMMTLYSRSLLPSWNKSWYMGVVVLVSYILLFVILNAESYALLIGSIGAFMVTALVMYLTRKLDWYGSQGKA